MVVQFSIGVLLKGSWGRLVISWYVWPALTLIFDLSGFVILIEWFTTIWWEDLLACVKVSKRGTKGRLVLRFMCCYTCSLSKMSCDQNYQCHSILSLAFIINLFQIMCIPVFSIIWCYTYLPYLLQSESSRLPWQASGVSTVSWQPLTRDR